MIQPFHLWAMATAAVVAAACGLVGSLLVVRRMSLVGDAIAHGILPGIAVAVLAGGRTGGPLVFVAAVVAAVVTVWLAAWLRDSGGVAGDAATGVVFTTMFALGVVIVSAAARQIDLDPGCVLYGILELVPFDTVTVAGREIPRGFLTGVVVLAGLAAAAVATWPWQVFTAFDPDGARVAGLPVGLVTGGLLAATAVATVAGFEVAGAILVVAMLVVPAAAAELLVRRLHLVTLVSMALAVAAAVAGYLLAWRWNTNAAGMIAVVLGGIYAAAVVLAPDDGLVARAVRRALYGWRVACEDRLATLWRAEEKGGVAAAAPGWWDRVVSTWLVRCGRVVRSPAGEMLSPAGRREAEMVVRSHRLWEAWLGRHMDLPLDHLHPPAEWVEHHLGAAMRERIAAEVGGSKPDPHGSEIPPERG
jgi:manganese/zinc/iron transport system permease protein